jgi:hypothetical protein
MSLVASLLLVLALLLVAAPWALAFDAADVGGVHYPH